MTNPQANLEAYNAAAERFNNRNANFEQFGYQLTPDQREVEAEYLNRERQRLLEWQAIVDEEQRSAARRADAAQLAANTGTAFMGISFRGKLGLVGLAMFGLGFLLRLIVDESSFAILLMTAGFVSLIIWFFTGLRRGRDGGGAGAHGEADRVRLEAMRAAAERQQQQEEHEQRLKEEAEARRQEAIARAQQQGHANGDEW